MIESYSLQWRVENVFWGWPKVAGTLLGAKTKAKNASTLDFRDQRSIYALYADYDLVYVGQTGAGEQRLFKRLKAHTKDHLSERWNRFSWFGTQWVTSQCLLSKDTAKLGASVDQALNILEAITIAVSEPRLNLQRGSWGNSEKYFQAQDGRLLEDQDGDEDDDT